MFRPRLHLPALGATLLIVALMLVAPRPMSAVDLRIYDLLLRVASGGPPSTRVAIVTVDDASLAAIGRWPWPRRTLAALADRLRELGAGVVAFDVLFAETERLDGASGEGPAASGDAALADALGRANAVVGFALTFGEGRSADAGCVLHPLPAAVVAASGSAPPAEQLFQADGSVCALPAIARSAGGSGFLNVGVDSDGTLRRLPLVMAHRGRIYPSLALAAALKAQPARELSLASGRDRPLWLAIDGRTIPLGERGTLMLRFRDPARRFSYIPAADVLNGRVAPGVLDGRIVFVGATALGVRDVVSTPIDRQYPGIEVHATAAENLLQGTFVAPIGYHAAVEILVTIAFGLGAAAAFGVRGRWGIPPAAAALLALWGACAWLLDVRHVYLSPLAPTLAAVTAIGAVALVRIGVERERADNERRRRRQAHEFVVKSLTSLMEMRDPSTGRHSRRTQGYSRLLAQRLAHTPEFHEYLTPDRIEFMSLLAPLHDIGKVGIRDAVLNKTGSLTHDEMSEMRQHPVYGYETISKAQRQVGVDSVHDEAVLRLAKEIVYTHHERWDGTGYPRGLRGEEIPVAGRIMALVDVYDALVEPRPYRRRMPHDEAVSLIVAGSGSQFDPDVVRAFLTVSDDFRELGTRLREAPQQSRL